MKKYFKEGMGLAATGIGLGVGSQVVGSTGVAASADIQKGLGSMSSGLKVMGSMTATGMQLESLGKIKKLGDKLK